MAILSDAQLYKIQEIIRRHHMAFVANAIGPEAVPPQVRAELKAAGLLSEDLGTIEDAYQYGQVLAAGTNPAVAKMSLTDFRAWLHNNPIPATPQEVEALRLAQQRAAQYAVGLGNRVQTTIVNETVVEAIQQANTEVAEQIRLGVREAVAEGIAQRKAVKKIVSDLQWSTKDFARDWDRIAVTEKQQAMQEGMANHYHARYGADSMVCKRPMPDACEHCKRLYLGADGNPIIFPLSVLQANGTNVGRKAKDWQAVIGTVHPFCCCQLIRVPAGWGFDEEGALVPGGEGGERYETAEDYALALLQRDDLRKGAICGTVEFQGLPIGIESRKGSVRKWTDERGNTGETRMLYDYGYIKRTGGVDGEEIDAYVGPDPRAPQVFIVHQLKPNGLYDEDKAFLGFPSEAVVRAAYAAHMTRPEAFGGITVMALDHFKRWVGGTGAMPGEGMVKGLRFTVPLRKAITQIHLARVIDRPQLVLLKGAGHKYLRRWKGPGGRYRYEYKALATNTLKVHEVGDKVRIKHRGQEGHFEVLKVMEKDGHRDLYIKHDETGKEHWISERALAELFRQSSDVKSEATAALHKIQAALGGYDPKQGPAVRTARPTKFWKAQLEQRQARIKRLFDPYNRYHSLTDYAAKMELYGYYKGEIQDVVAHVKPILVRMKAELDASEVPSSWDIRSKYIQETREEFKALIGPIHGLLDTLNFTITGSHSVDHEHPDPEVQRLERAAGAAGQKLEKPAEHVFTLFQGLFIGEINPDKWEKAAKSKITRYFNLLQTATTLSTEAMAAKANFDAAERDKKKALWEIEAENAITGEVIGTAGTRFLLQQKHATTAQKARTAQHLESLEASIRKVRSAGFGDAVKGLTVFVDYRPADKRAKGYAAGHGELVTAGTYTTSGGAFETTANTGQITVFSNGFRDAQPTEVMTHEIGHRYYYQSMTEGERAEWEAAVEAHSVTPTQEDVAKVWAAVRDKHEHATYEDMFDRGELLRDLRENHGDVGEALAGQLAQVYSRYGTRGNTAEKKYVKERLDAIAGHRLIKPFVSFYGGSNASEYFAEAFQFYIDGGPRNLPEWTRAIFERVTSRARVRKSREDEDSLQKAGPFIGPKGGKWADPEHTIPWHPGMEGHTRIKMSVEALVQAVYGKPVSYLDLGEHDLGGGVKVPWRKVPADAQVTVVGSRGGGRVYDSEGGWIADRIGPELGARHMKKLIPEAPVAKALPAPYDALEKARKKVDPNQMSLFGGGGDATHTTPTHTPAGGPFIGPRGGKWADPAHKIPWEEAGSKETKAKKPKPERSPVKAPEAPVHTPTMGYQYGMYNRPPGPGAIPKGEWTHEAHPDFRHGVITYSKPLTPEEIKNYELVPLLSGEDIGKRVDKAAADVMADYPEETRELAKDSPREFAQMARYALTEQGPGHLPDLDKLVETIRQKVLATCEQKSSVPKSFKVKINGNLYSGGHPDTEVTYHVVAEKGDQVQISQHENGHGPWMPKSSVQHFINDLAGKVDVTANSTNAYVNEVAKGKAKFLGKGDDGLAFKVGEKVVRVSTTVPYNPDNPGHRSPSQAVAMLRGQSELGNKLADLGIAGIQRSEFVEHEDKGFQIKPWVEIPEKWTREQLDAIQDIVIAVHKAGYGINNSIQAGLDGDGNPILFDVGKAGPIESDDPIYGSVSSDMSSLGNLYYENKQPFVRRDVDVAEQRWQKVTKETIPRALKAGKIAFAQRHLNLAAEMKRKQLRDTLSGKELEDALYIFDEFTLNEGQYDIDQAKKKLDAEAPKAQPKTVKLSEAVQSFFETDVHELATDPEGHGLDEKEAKAYKLLAQAHDQKAGTLLMPSTKADAERLVQLVTDLSNSADDRAEAGEDKAFNNRVAGALATLGGKIRKHSETLEKSRPHREPVRKALSRRVSGSLSAVEGSVATELGASTGPAIGRNPGAGTWVNFEPGNIGHHPAEIHPAIIGWDPRAINPLEQELKRVPVDIDDYQLTLGDENTRQARQEARPVEIADQLYFRGDGIDDDVETLRRYWDLYARTHGGMRNRVDVEDGVMGADDDDDEEGDK